MHGNFYGILRVIPVEVDAGCGGGGVQDITHGQIYVQILHLDILVATILINWAMTFLPDGTWLRESSLLGVPAGIGRSEAETPPLPYGWMHPSFPACLLNYVSDVLSQLGLLDPGCMLARI